MYVAACSIRSLVRAAGCVLPCSRVVFPRFFTITAFLFIEDNIVMTFDTEMLIREVVSRKAIWDVTSDEYSDRDLKIRRWEEIINIMCVDS